MVPYYEIAGAGAPAIVFTHGLAATGETWGDQVRDLRTAHRVATWDLPGHGRSAPPAPSCTLGTLAVNLRDVLDDAGLSRAVVLGHSAGGVVVMRFALDFPERVAGMVLVGTASECNTRAHDFYHQLADMALERGMPPVARRLGLGRVCPPVDPTGFGILARCMAGLRDHPLTTELASIRCPTRIIVGEKDFLGVGGSVILSCRIPGSRLEIVPGRGHGLFLEDPTDFNQRLRDFLKEVAAR